MKASYNWLKEFVEFSLPHKDLAHTLTMAGFEVEAIEEYEDDIIFDIGITPNRPDCLSIRGIAREISAILELPLKDTSVKINDDKTAGPDVTIENKELCSRYSSRVISGVKPGPSPRWLSKRLESCGFRSTSNIVDITNYVMLELGQPLHAFDLDMLAGKRIVVKQADDIGKFTTLDDEERTLSGEMLLIWDADKPVAIAGVMGGQNTEVSDSTTNVLLESAYFKPASVRRTSKALNLSTESSYRFERGIDLKSVAFALDRAAQLISEMAGGRITSITDNYPEPYRQRRISVSFEKIKSVIGVDVQHSFIENALVNLGFDIEREGEGLAVVPPGYRDDVERDIDIVEEIARLYGYDNIPSTLPVMQMSAAPEHKTQELVKTLKHSMVKSGYSEAINFSFLNPEAVEKLKLPSGDRRRNLIYIKNPLRKEESAMRTTLIPALLHNAETNINRGEKMLRLFEISRVFLPSGRNLPDEIVQMAVIFCKEKTASIWEHTHDGYYDVKGVLENVFSGLMIENTSFKHEQKTVEPYLHPGKSASIIINDERIGAIGTLNPEAAETFDLSGDITIAEIFNVERILNAVPSESSYSALPKYPYVERDLSIVVSRDMTVDKARNTINSINSDLIESIELFDIYTGKPIPPEQKSMAFSIRYRSAERTLTDSEIDNLHLAILNKLKEELHAELR
jgi:phenylalanyl-tRNA synthetase beta chain